VSGGLTMVLLGVRAVGLLCALVSLDLGLGCFGASTLLLYPCIYLCRPTLAMSPCNQRDDGRYRCEKVPSLSFWLCSVPGARVTLTQGNGHGHPSSSSSPLSSFRIDV
jgi:hypothetical protein